MTLQPCLLLAVALVAAAPPALRADEGSDKDARIRNLEKTVQELQKTLQHVQDQLTDLKRQPAADPAPAPGDDTAGRETYLKDWASAFGKSSGRAFDFGVVGDVVTRFSKDGRQGERGADGATFREAELVFGANIDPYSRGDLVVAFPGGGTPELEEGYLTWMALPGGIDKLQAGKVRSPFGKINRIHQDGIPQVDYPRVVTRFFGDEGLSDTGASVSRIFDNPWNVFSQVSYTLGNGENATAFDAKNQSEPMHLAHWTNFFEVGGKSGIELGASGAYGSQNRRERNAARYGGLDLTYVWKKDRTRSFRFQNELIWMERQRFQAHPDVTDLNVKAPDEDKFGMYSFAEYQWAQRWAGGLRYDYVEIPGEVFRDKEWALTPYVTFFQSEFMRLRLEFSHRERLGAHTVDNFFQKRDTNAIALQGTFILGSHRPHPY